MQSLTITKLSRTLFSILLLALTLLAYFVPYYFAVIIALNWASRGLIVPILNDVSQVLGALEKLKAWL